MHAERNIAAISNISHVSSINPATDEEIARYPLHDKDAQEDILIAAYQGQRRWAAIPVEARAKIIAAAADQLRAAEDQLAELITLEMGKPITAARAEVGKCAALCDWYGNNAAALLAEETADVAGDGEARIAFLPLGTILAVMPWNFPLWQALRAAIPILAAGNAFLLKHADNVQGCAFALADVLAKAGLPDGVFAVLNVDRDALPALIADRRITAVTVTAGVAAGAAIAAEAGRNLKKSVLELGGSDPFIVLADADLDRAVPAAIEARFQNCGQVCIAAKRIIVERTIADTFLQRFVAAARDLTPSDPRDPQTRLGPMARHRLRSELQTQVDESVELGAKVLLGGKPIAGPGAYYPATVLIDVTPDMPVFAQETFGPVAAIIVADDPEDAVRIANDSNFGLSGALWSGDPKKAASLARQIETGGIFINGIAASDPRVPIGGIKHSGYGRELSHFGIREFCNAQLVWQR